MRGRTAASWSALAICLLALALLVSGCGGGDGDDSSQAESGASTAEQTTSGHEEGGEKSIEDFGEKASGSDEEAILASFKGSLNALSEEDFATACGYLAANVEASLKQLVGGKGKGMECPEILPKLLSPSAPSVAKQQANGEVTRVRIEGDNAFVVFHAPGAKRYMMPLVEEDGEWKTSTVIPSVLVPEL